MGSSGDENKAESKAAKKHHLDFFLNRVYPSEVTHLQMLSSDNPKHDLIYERLCCGTEGSCWRSRPGQARAGGAGGRAEPPARPPFVSGHTGVPFGTACLQTLQRHPAIKTQREWQ